MEAADCRLRTYVPTPLTDLHTFAIYNLTASETDASVSLGLLDLTNHPKNLVKS